MFLLTLILAVIPLYLLYIHLKWAAEDRKIGVPGPPCLPVIGNFHILWKHIRTKTVHERTVQLMDEYGETMRMRVGPKLVILTRDVKVIEQIVNNPKFGKSQDYQMYKPWLGNGLLLSSGEKWHKMRKLLTPAFHFQILERFIPIYEEQGTIFLSKLRSLDDKKVIDVVPWYHSFALDVISETSMGYKPHAQTDTESKFVKANKDLLNTIVMRFFFPIYRIEFLWKMSKYYKIVEEQINFIHGFVDNIINERREKLLAEKYEPENSRPALLDILLKASIDEKPLSNEEIRSEVNNFMLAGHETTGTTLGFLTFVLAKHQDVQKLVYEEIVSHDLQNPERKLTIRDINSLSYFETVMKETLRMFPILGGAHKSATEDIRINNIFIPAYTSISTSIRAGHLYEKNFKDALKFDPSRWNDEVSTKERSPYAYQPFSSGLRNCIGQKFALLEMKTLMIQILREFIIELGRDDFEMDIKHGSLLYSENGVQVKFRKR
ncbi:cytochrome P450 4d1-like [Culicoides brevitarsis]|uniref:cytochrome P450 4d1-like n=1 Tax=Culicoides brevitarsis TaxID=469753 RepID=UPI00307B46E2